MDVYFTVLWVFCTFEILLSKTLKGFPDSSVGKESACNAVGGKKSQLTVLLDQLFPCSNIEVLPADFTEKLELFLQRAGFGVVCSYSKQHFHKLFTGHLHLNAEIRVRMSGKSNSNEGDV